MALLTEDEGPALYTTRFRLMGGGAVVRFVDRRGRAAAEALARAVESEALRIEVKFSRFREGSVVSEINRDAGRTPVAVDEETDFLVGAALDLWKESGGRFDPTVGALRKAWDFKAQRVPSPEEVAALLPLVSGASVSRRDGTVFLRKPGHGDRPRRRRQGVRRGPRGRRAARGGRLVGDRRVRGRRAHGREPRRRPRRGASESPIRAEPARSRSR